jgi:hypothetical protein
MMVMAPVAIVMAVIIVMAVMTMATIVVVMMAMPFPMIVMMAMPAVMRVPMMVIMRRRIDVPVVRLERRRQVCALESVRSHQRLDFGLLLQPDAIGEDLHRDLAVAERDEEMRDGGEIPRRVLGAHLDHRLDVGDDLGETAVVKQQDVIRGEARRFRKIELDAGSLAAGHDAVPAAPVVELQQQRIGDVARPGTA